MPHRTASDIPSQQGRTAVVTGTGGIGFEVALALARAGASVVIAGRDPSKGAAALRRIHEQVADARVQFRELDLASLASIRQFGQGMLATCAALDLLVNNAGVMTPPSRRMTADGFELQMGTNHLGHFALTAQLLPLLRQGIGPRVVTLSSIAARQGRIDFDNLQAQQHYRPMEIYCQSKLACLMFALELQRRSDEADWGLRSMASHPGVSRTDLLLNGAGAWSLPGIARRVLWFLFQPAALGAQPTLFAATSPRAEGGQYFGPGGWGELRGSTTPVGIPRQALAMDVSARLWAESERLTGSAYPAVMPPQALQSAAFQPTQPAPLALQVVR